jgi:hypothetical protein
VTQADALTRPVLTGGVCLLCCRPVGPAERHCPAFALAGIAAHAGCCGGCATGPAHSEPTADRSAVAA